MRVTLEPIELQALLDLAQLANIRLTTAEALYYDGLLSRMKQELAAQVQADAQANGLPSDHTEHSTLA